MEKLTLRDLDLAGKHVLMRVDFNVPLDEKGEVADDTRIRGSLPSIQYIIDKKAKLILLSHLGRPDGKVVEKYRLTPVARRLSQLLGRDVLKADDCLGPEVERRVAQLQVGQVLILENVRFYPEEEKNDPGFAKQLACLGDLFVNDAFGTAHRAHASTEGVAHFLPSAAGFLMEKEIRYLGQVLSNPRRPFAAILGGAKVSDKIGVIDRLMSKVDLILIGGGMAYTFLKAQGIPIGKSKLEADKVDLAKQILDRARVHGVEILLPEDHVIVETIDPSAKVEVKRGGIPDGWIGVDIGPKTAEIFCKRLRGVKTILWNGPLGIFEMEPFSHGSRQVAVSLGGPDVVTIIGGGDTAACIAKFGLESKMTHISTGGGAALEFLEGKVLPGIAALTDKGAVRV